MNLTPYHPDHLAVILRFVGECALANDFLGCLHPGDIGHAISNGLRHVDPAEYLFTHHDGGGAIDALILLSPAGRGGYDVMIRPNVRTPAFEQAMLAAGDRRMTPIILANAPADEPGVIASQKVGSEVVLGNHARHKALLALGYAEDDEPSMHMTRRSLDDIPDSVLSGVFTLRLATVEDADAVSIAHAGAFESKWTAEMYKRTMQSPGFVVAGAREWIAVAPDGRVAAFAVVWPDAITRCGLFEPVGCHPDFQRRGLTRALLYAGMHDLRAAGMTHAIVMHEAADENPAAAALYASVGFQPRYDMSDYSRRIT